MLALRIIATVFVGLSCITTIVKTVESVDVDDHPGAALLFIIYGWLWRVLVIVALWVI